MLIRGIYIIYTFNPKWILKAYIDLTDILPGGELMLF